MANKNKHVIISYFPNKDLATAAAKQLKKWDKANKDIKLGGIGILTWHKNRIKTHLVGSRAAGTGAKWGIALGAITGILSGGITLIGGAVAGVATGAVLGSFFHKHLGLTDADKERLERHLQDGGAAVVVMADENEVKPTATELVRLGGPVDNYQIPDETMEHVEKSSHVEAVSDDDLVLVTGVRGNLVSVEGIGPSREAALMAIGINSKQELLDKGATPAGRAEIAKKAQLGEKLVANWVSAIDLSRVKGIGSQYGELLQAAGVASVGDLASQDASSLLEKMRLVNAERNLVREMPNVSYVENWVNQAKNLPQVVTF